MESMIEYLSRADLSMEVKISALRGYTTNLIELLAQVAEQTYEIDDRGRAYEYSPVGQSIAKRIRARGKEFLK